MWLEAEFPVPGADVTQARLRLAEYDELIARLRIETGEADADPNPRGGRG